MKPLTITSSPIAGCCCKHKLLTCSMRPHLQQLLSGRGGSVIPSTPHSKFHITLLNQNNNNNHVDKGSSTGGIKFNNGSIEGEIKFPTNVDGQEKFGSHSTTASAVMPSHQHIVAKEEKSLQDKKKLQLVETGGVGKGEKKRLIILGVGWGGFRLIKDIDLNLYDVSVVSPRNHFLFTPLLPSAASGTLEFRSIIEPLRRARRHENYHYFEASCTKIRSDVKRIECKPNHKDDPPFELQYDELVVAVGCDVNTMGIEVVDKYAFFLKEITDARKIRMKIIECFERASNPNTSIHLREQLLHFLIVGAGPTGVEAAAEIHDLIEQDLKHYFPEHIYLDVRITILEAGKQILTAFDESLRRYTQNYFRRQRIQIYMGAKVKALKNENCAILEDGSEIDCGFVLWSAGIQARPLILQSDSHQIPLDPRTSKIIVDDYLRVKGMPHIYSIGDCSIVESKQLPATAQVAQQQGRYLAELLNATEKQQQNTNLDSEQKNNEEIVLEKIGINPFAYQHRGLMAYIGDFHAITETKGLKLRGYLSWFLYRSAYLTKLVSIKNKILVPMDWFKTLLFGRDISRF